MKKLSAEHKKNIGISLIGKNLGRKFTNEHKLKLSIARKKFLEVPSNHPGWKGKKASYRAVHAFIIRRYGKPNKCEDCGKENLSGHHVHWSNMDHKYNRDIKEWKKLCPKCHGKNDTQLRKKQNGNISKQSNIDRKLNKKSRTQSIA